MVQQLRVVSKLSLFLITTWNSPGIPLEGSRAGEPCQATCEGRGRGTAWEPRNMKEGKRSQDPPFCCAPHRLLWEGKAMPAPSKETGSYGAGVGHVWLGWLLSHF